VSQRGCDVVASEPTIRGGGQVLRRPPGHRSGRVDLIRKYVNNSVIHAPCLLWSVSWPGKVVASQTRVWNSLSILLFIL